MYCEWYGVCDFYDFVVLSVVEVCADYGGVVSCIVMMSGWVPFLDFVSDAVYVGSMTMFLSFG